MSVDVGLNVDCTNVTQDLSRERRSQARHFCNLAIPGLKQRFSVGTPNAGSQAGKIVLSMGTQIFP